MEHKSVSLELKDFSPGSRTAVLAHAVYNNIDRTQDISRKGMFTKSWNEIKAVDFLFNHKDGQTPGSVTRLFEDEAKAYTEVKFGNWTLGNDAMEMIDAGSATSRTDLGRRVPILTDTLMLLARLRLPSLDKV